MELFYFFLAALALIIVGVGIGCMYKADIVHELTSERDYLKNRLKNTIDKL